MLFQSWKIDGSLAERPVHPLNRTKIEDEIGSPSFEASLFKVSTNKIKEITKVDHLVQVERQESFSNLALDYVGMQVKESDCSSKDTDEILIEHLPIKKRYMY